MQSNWRQLVITQPQPTGDGIVDPIWATSSLISRGARRQGRRAHWRKRGVEDAQALVGVVGGVEPTIDLHYDSMPPVDRVVDHGDQLLLD